MRGSREANLCTLVQTRLSSCCEKKAWLLPKRRYVLLRLGLGHTHCLHQSEAASTLQAARNALEGLVCVAMSNTAAVAVEVRTIFICMLALLNMHPCSWVSAGLQVNTETDFAARNAEFTQMLPRIAQAVLASEGEPMQHCGQ